MLIRWRPGELARNSIGVMGWNAARIAAQLAWVVLLVRTLGVNDYGILSGITGLALAGSGLAGSGFGWRLYQDVARDQSLFSRRWAQATRMLVWSSAVVASTFLLIGSWLFPLTSFAVLVAVALSELALMPFVHLASCAFSAHGRIVIASALPVAVSLSRVLAVVALSALPLEKTLDAYAWLHLLSTSGIVVMLRITTVRTLAPGHSDIGIDLKAFREGVGFASVWASGTALTSVDKVLALRIGGPSAAGEYTAAFRFAHVACLPVEAMASAVLPRLFGDDAQANQARRLIGHMLLTTVVYGATAGGLVWWLASPLASLLLIDASSAVEATRALAMYVPAYCLYILGVHVLMGYGWKRWRLTSDLVGLAVMASLMVYWIPVTGSVGASRALLWSEVLLAAMTWVRIGIGMQTFGAAR